jgi:DnaJ-class molecular chaperone
MNECFETLGVEETATLEEIKAAYRRCLKLYHPDTYVGDKSEAERMTRKVIDAYKTIISKKSCLSPLKLSHYYGSIGRVWDGSEAIFG